MKPLSCYGRHDYKQRFLQQGERLSEIDHRIGFNMKVGEGQVAALRLKDPAIRCLSLVKRYGDLVAVDGLDLEVARGECFGLLGPNGAGKTTTVEIIEGINVPDSGAVELLGCCWGKGGERALRARIGIQLQETQFSERLTVEETIRLFRSFYKYGRDVKEVIRTVGLEEKRTTRVGKVSGGQKQRLALACSLVGDPEVLFLDEPTTGLDPQARFMIWELIEEFRRQDVTVMLTTHYMEEAARLCDRVAIMDRGRVIDLGSPAELVDSLGADQVIEFKVTGEFNGSCLEQLPGVTGVTKRNGDFLITVPHVADTLPALMTELNRQEVSLEALTTHQATLEDVFLKLTGRKLRDG
jgi:ABC-2 type transport system ATP-binding protein